MAIENGKVLVGVFANDNTADGDSILIFNPAAEAGVVGVGLRLVLAQLYLA